MLLKPIDHSTSRTSPLLPSTSPPMFFFSFSVSFYKTPVIYFAYLNSSFVFSCVSTLAIMSIVVVNCCCRFRGRYFEKELLPKETFFCNYEKKKKYSMCDTRCTSLPCLSYNCKRRSWDNFRGRYITRKTYFFLAYVLDLGLANDICIYRKRRPYVTLNASLSKKKMYSI